MDAWDRPVKGDTHPHKELPHLSYFQRPFSALSPSPSLANIANRRVIGLLALESGGARGNSGGTMSTVCHVARC